GVPEADVVLVSAEALWKSWGMKSESRKRAAPESPRHRYEVLRAQGLDFPMARPASRPEELDAAAAALAAYLWATGQAASEGPRVEVLTAAPFSRQTRG